MDNEFLEKIAGELDLDGVVPLAVGEQDKPWLGAEGETGTGKTKGSPSLNAERLRRHRQKKKKERENMYKENQVLKQQREEHLKMIADLEMEVEALRTQGVVDLSKENELLKAEIKKHKAYIDRVVEVALNTPNGAEEIERLRILRNALEGGAGHVIGLTYASINSNLWTKAKSLTLNITEEVVLDNVLLWYQYLPVGAADEDVKRVNLRFEIADIPVEFEALADSYWKMNSTEELIQEQIKSCPHSGHLKLEVVVPKTTLAVGEETVCMCLKNVNRKAVQNLFVSSYKHTEMYPMAFPQVAQDNEATGTEKVRMVFNSACGPLPKVTSPGTEIVQDENLDGYIFRRSPSGGTSVTIIQSMPLSGALFELAIEGVMQKRRHISENNDLHPMIAAVQEQRLRGALQYYEG